MDAEEWVDANRHLFGSDYERLFALTVLPLVKGLGWDDVQAQYPFLDKDGKQRYSDFAILESENVRLAIEVDGYDKKGDGTGMSHADFVDWQRRQASLASQGWHVLRFANRDVRDFPESCAEHITELLTKLRMNEGGRVQIVTVHGQKYEPPLPFKEGVNGAPAQQKSMLPSSPMVLGIAIAVIFLFILAFIKKRDAPDALELSTKASEVMSASEKTAEPPQEYSDEGNGNFYGDLKCERPIDWRDAAKHIGEFVTVTGPLVEAKASQKLSGKPLWLNIGNAFPSKDRLSAVIWGSNWPNFRLSALGVTDNGRDVFGEGRNPVICLAGVVGSYNGVPQIEIQSAHQIMISYHHDNPW